MFHLGISEVLIVQDLYALKLTDEIYLKIHSLKHQVATVISYWWSGNGQHLVFKKCPSG